MQIWGWLLGLCVSTIKFLLESFPQKETGKITLLSLNKIFLFLLGIDVMFILHYDSHVNFDFNTY